MCGLRPIGENEFPDSGRFLQTRYWGRLKSRFGWTPHYFQITGTSTTVGLLALSRRLAPGIRLAYVPDAPSQPPNGADSTPGDRLLTDLGAELAAEIGPVCVRFDLPWVRAQTAGSLESASRLRRAVVDVQPPDTTIVDLSADEDAILAAMKSRCRRNIRKADKAGLTVRSSADVREFYELYRITAARDRITIHSEAYYRAVLETATDDSAVDAELLVAEYRDTPIAAVMVAYAADEAVYLYGASSNEYRETMPAYALQWDAMRRAKGRGCIRYDLFGIPPTDDEDHPMHGLYRFKTGFGGRIVHRAGCWDYVAKPVAYSLYREAERVRQFYYKRIRKRRS